MSHHVVNPRTLSLWQKGARDAISPGLSRVKNRSVLGLDSSFCEAQFPITRARALSPKGGLVVALAPGRDSGRATVAGTEATRL